MIHKMKAYSKQIKTIVDEIKKNQSLQAEKKQQKSKRNNTCKIHSVLS